MLRMSVAVAIVCMSSGAAFADCGADHGSSAKLDDSSAKLNATPIAKAAVKQAVTKKATPAKATKRALLACENPPCSEDPQPLVVPSKREAVASAR